jgi:hypothetical protein
MLTRLSMTISLCVSCWKHMFSKRLTGYMMYWAPARITGCMQRHLSQTDTDCPHRVSMIMFSTIKARCHDLLPFRSSQQPGLYHSRPTQIIPKCSTGLLLWSHIPINPLYY